MGVAPSNTLRAVKGLEKHGYLILVTGDHVVSNRYTASYRSTTFMSEEGVLEVRGDGAVVSRNIPVIERSTREQGVLQQNTGVLPQVQNGFIEREHERDHRSRSSKQEPAALVEEAEEEPRPFLTVPGDCDHLPVRSASRPSSRDAA